MKQKELYKKVAEELDLPEDKVRFVIESYEQAIRWFISNPVYAGIKIIVPELLAFRVNKPKLKEKLTKAINKNPESARVKYLTYFMRRYVDKDFAKNKVDIPWPLD